jgi:enamine deaminase RidA (YjgF/YER057c/UK114 family)
MPNESVSAEHPEAKLAAKGLVLPGASTPVAAYVPAKRVGNLVYTAGQIPMQAGALIATGPVPSKVSVELAREAAVQCALNGLAAIKGVVGDLAKVKQVVKLDVFVQSDDGFAEQPKVANAASELMIEIFGEAGKHARAAVGTNALPLGASVEIAFVVEVGE